MARRGTNAHIANAATLRNPSAVPQSAQPPSSLPPIIASLRQSVVFAEVTNFLYTFKPAINLDALSATDIENDLLQSPGTLLPSLLHRLLVILTADRKITVDNFSGYLSKQFSKRLPDLPNPLGSLEEPVQYVSLEPLEKIELLARLCQWQFTGVARLRQMMGDEGEEAWRLEPIGQDAKGIKYWFIGGDRLWIQRSKPKPPPVKRKLKLKLPPPPPPPKKAPSTVVTLRTRGAGRSSTRQAEAKRKAPPSPVVGSPSKRMRLVGTRVSSRLRQDQDDGEWQAIPEEWLNGASTSTSTSQAPVKEVAHELFDDELSDLTELSDEKKGNSLEPSQVEKDESSTAQTPQPTEPDFIEWETICVTLQEWETIVERFAGSRNPHEKHLYNMLVAVSGPLIANIKDQARQASVLAALEHRKRSSRLMDREAELASIEAARAEKKAKEEQKRKEEQERKQEQERQRKEQEREKRFKEREERLLERLASKELASSKNATPIPETEKKENKPDIDESADDWELACEICRRHGRNISDDSNMVQCSRCARWQHTYCHDVADKKAGRPLRNWDVVNFVCKACLEPHEIMKEKARQEKVMVKLSKPKTPPSHPKPKQTTSRNPTAKASSKLTNGAVAPQVPPIRRQNNPPHPPQPSPQAYSQHYSQAQQPQQRNPSTGGQSGSPNPYVQPYFAPFPASNNAYAGYPQPASSYPYIPAPGYLYAPQQNARPTPNAYHAANNTSPLANPYSNPSPYPYATYMPPYAPPQHASVPHHSPPRNPDPPRPSNPQYLQSSRTS